MRKSLFLVSSLMVLSSLVSCGNNECNHAYTETVFGPTCTEDGYTLHACSKCHEEFKDNYITKLGHDFSDVVELDGPTLEGEEGDELRYCERCHKVLGVHTSSINNEENGVGGIRLDDNLLFTGEYMDEYYVLHVKTNYHSNVGTVYFTMNPDEGRKEDKTFKAEINFSNKNITLKAYDGANYTKNVAGACLINFVDDPYEYFEHQIDIKVSYSYYGLNKDNAIGKFGFYPELQAANGMLMINYEFYNPYVCDYYSETWIKANSKNNFYYNTEFQNNKVENWERADLTEADINYTFSFNENTIERSIVAGLVGQKHGAKNLDIHIENLEKNGVMTEENLTKLFHSFTIPTLALCYNGSISQEQRLNNLKLAAKCGASGVDVQGFMYHSGSTLNTQTQENVQYWENKGYNMDFVKANPVQTVLDPEEDKLQVDYIKEIHELGAKVLSSNHVDTVLTKSQAVNLGIWIDHKDVDIIKIVAYAKSKKDIEAMSGASVEAYNSNKIKAKYSIHSNFSPVQDITRIINPLFFHSYMCFCYYNLIHLDMMIELLNSDIVFDDSLTAAEAINALKGKSNDPELERTIAAYESIIETSFVYKAFGASSEMSDRWVRDENVLQMNLRNATGTNKFSIRGVAYDEKEVSNSFSIESVIDGSMLPFTSSNRLPKLGLYVGDCEKMVALVYEMNTDDSGLMTSGKIDVLRNPTEFGFDTKPVGDRLTTSLLEAPVSCSSNICDGDYVKLKIEYSEGRMSFYYSLVEGNEMTLIATIDVNDLEDYFTHDASMKTNYGNVFEIYMGSSSVGSENWIRFKNNF